MDQTDLFGNTKTATSEGAKAGFNRWWACYRGKRSEKMKCIAIWNGKRQMADGHKRKLEPIADEICRAVEAQHQAKAHHYGDKVCWPNARTWLYNARWEDEVDVKYKTQSLESLGRPVVDALWGDVCKIHPDLIVAGRGTMEAQRAMRKLAKQKGLL